MGITKTAFGLGRLNMEHHIAICPECKKQMKYLGDKIYKCYQCDMTWSASELRDLEIRGLT